MDITKLPDEWRNVGSLEIWADDCANELEAALPKWTRITDDLASMPKESEHEYAIFYNTENGIGHTYLYKTTNSIAMHSGWKTFASHWRPLCDLDRPPEQS